MQAAAASIGLRNRRSLRVTARMAMGSGDHRYGCDGDGRARVAMQAAAASIDLRTPRLQLLRLQVPAWRCGRAGGVRWLRRALRAPVKARGARLWQPAACDGRCALRSVPFRACVILNFGDTVAWSWKMCTLTRRMNLWCRSRRTCVCAASTTPDPIGLSR